MAYFTIRCLKAEVDGPKTRVWKHTFLQFLLWRKWDAQSFHSASIHSCYHRGCSGEWNLFPASLPLASRDGNVPSGLEKLVLLRNKCKLFTQTWVEAFAMMLISLHVLWCISCIPYSLCDTLFSVLFSFKYLELTSPSSRESETVCHKLSFI